MWTCKKCGHTIQGNVVLPVHCLCESGKPASGPIPHEDWPLWAKLIALRKIDSDVGVGDTAQRYAARVGGERFKKFAKRKGIPCGCTERQAQWNTLYKYKNTLQVVMP